VRDGSRRGRENVIREFKAATAIRDANPVEVKAPSTKGVRFAGGEAHSDRVVATNELKFTINSTPKELKEILEIARRDLDIAESRALFRQSRQKGCLDLPRGEVKGGLKKPQGPGGPSL